MNEILGKVKSVRELLKGAKYSIDYYQREYQWQEKQIQELVEDLTSRFLEDYRPDHSRERVADYGQYFLGSVILSRRENAVFIVDGQQRITSLTLLLMHLRNEQQNAEQKVNVDELIFSEKFGNKSFNMDVPERTKCMESLFAGSTFDVAGQSESIQNIIARYRDVESLFPSEIDDQARPYFIDWLLENVRLVEITAFTDEDAYTIFETMNDRGLSLTPAEMLKGYLLANISSPAKRDPANLLWKKRVQELVDCDEESESDFFKAWFRSKYATKIRERKKGASPEDFDLIGTEFHRWLRDHRESVGLKNGDDFADFICTDFDFYSRKYQQIVEASFSIVSGLEPVRFIRDYGFTMQPMLLLSPLVTGDSDAIVKAKMSLVAKFLDILLARRLWNFRSISYSTMQYAMFLVMRDIRGLGLVDLSIKLYDSLQADDEVFENNERLRLHQQNRNSVHCLLARITDAVEVGSGNQSRYVDLVRESGKNRFEVEHVWADKPERHTDEFAHPADFAEYRNQIGALLLLPKSFNASYGALTYADKLDHYNGQNLLARSLHPMCYTHNPGFTAFVSRTGLAFHPHAGFKKADIDERSALYRQIAEHIWNPDQLLIAPTSG